MSVKVVDTSALAALVFAEPAANQVANALGDGEVVAPSLLWFEMASVCLKKIKRHPSKKKELMLAFSLASQLDIGIVKVYQQEVISLAQAKGLTSYDAAYLWLARRLSADLITLDKQLSVAASEGG